MEGKPRDLFQLFQASSETNKTNGITDIQIENTFHSYQDVYDKAVKMSLQLHEKLQKGSRVGLFIESSMERVILVLALLKRGIVIVPINSSSSMDVIQHITAEAHLEVVFVSRKYEELWKNHSINIQTFSIEDISEAKPCDDKTVEEIGSDHPALIVYTSGSTGKPKGVIISHANIIAMTEYYRERYHLEASTDIISLCSVFSYLSHWVEFFNSTINGIPCVMLNEDTLRNLPLLCNLLQEFKVTFFVGTFSILGELSKFTTNNPVLAKFTAGSEVFQMEQMQHFCKSFPNAKVFNEYGLTETTFTVSIPDKDIFSNKSNNIIGRGILNSKMYVVDANGCLVEDGIEGELWVSGPTVALGYVDKELDQQYFIKDPFDDDSKYKVIKTGDYVRMTDEGIEYVGRRDNIVKIRGHKVNILEVERTINTLFPEVQAYVSTKLNAGTSLLELYAYYLPTETSISVVRKKVISSLSYCQVPKFFRVNDFPRTTSGKVDRRMLSKYCTDEAEIMELLESESSLNKIKYATCKVLDITPDSFDPSQSFFQHGGDSLSVFLFLKELNSLGFTILFDDILNQPTLGSLCSFGTGEAHELKSKQVDNFEIALFSDLTKEELYCVGKELHKQFVARNIFVKIHHERGELDEEKTLAMVNTAFETFPHLCLSVKKQGKIVGILIMCATGKEPWLETSPLAFVTFLQTAEKDVITELRGEGHVVMDSSVVYIDEDMKAEESIKALKQLLDKKNELAKKNGFTAIVSINVSPATQGIASFVYQSIVKKRVYPHSFEMNGTHPYTEIHPDFYIEVAVDYL